MPNIEPILSFIRYAISQSLLYINDPIRNSATDTTFQKSIYFEEMVEAKYPPEQTTSAKISNALIYARLGSTTLGTNFSSKIRTIRLPTPITTSKIHGFITNISIKRSIRRLLQPLSHKLYIFIKAH